jgi:hypothetical protein
MIVGSCVYDGCDEPLMLEAPEGIQFPAFYRHECEGCHRVMWTKFSRVDPCSWTEEGFLEGYTVDEATHKIEPRNPPPPPTKEQLLFQALYDKVMHDAVMDMMIYGVGFHPKA